MLPKKSFGTRIGDRIKYNYGLKTIETLQISDSGFWKKFLYVMPRIGYDNTKPAVITKGSSKASKQTSGKASMDEDEYAKDYKDVKSLRHIIVPVHIPEFMRTQLGFNKKSKKAQLEELSRTDKHTHKISLNQSADYDVTKRVSGFSDIPFSPTTTQNTEHHSSINYHKRTVPPRSPSRATHNMSVIDSSQNNYKMRAQSPVESAETRSSSYHGRRRNSGASDILALVKIDPSTTIKETPERKTRSSSRQKSPEKYDRSELRSADRSSSHRRRSEDGSRLSNSSSAKTH